MSLLRRYEILLPLLSNDGSPIPETLLAETFAELREKFGAASWETQTVQGMWEHEGAIYRDNLTRFLWMCRMCRNIACFSKPSRKN
jgi:hypothetical protein